MGKRNKSLGNKQEKTSNNNNNNNGVSFGFGCYPNGCGIKSFAIYSCLFIDFRYKIA